MFAFAASPERRPTSPPESRPQLSQRPEEPCWTSQPRLLTTQIPPHLSSSVTVFLTPSSLDPSRILASPPLSRQLRSTARHPTRFPLPRQPNPLGLRPTSLRSLLTLRPRPLPNPATWPPSCVLSPLTMSFFTKRNRSNSSKGQDQPAPPSASSSNAKPTPSSSLDQLSSASPSPPQPQQPAQFANQQQQQQRNRTVSASSQGGTRGGPMGPPPPPPAQVNSLDQRRAPAPAVGRGFPSEQPAQGPPPPSKPILPW
jgi:hypothetical protein